MTMAVRLKLFTGLFFFTACAQSAQSQSPASPNDGPPIVYVQPRPGAYLPGATPDNDPLALASEVWAKCVKDIATKWASQRDSADVIADGAIGHCEPQQAALKQALIEHYHLVHFGGIAEDASAQNIANARESMRNRAIAVVLDVRGRAAAQTRKSK